MLKSMHIYVAVAVGLALYQGSAGAAYFSAKRAASSAFMAYRASLRRLGATAQHRMPGSSFMPKAQLFFQSYSPYTLKSQESIFGKMLRDALKESPQSPQGNVPSKPAAQQPSAAHRGEKEPQFSGAKYGADTPQQEATPVPKKDTKLPAAPDVAPNMTKDFVLIDKNVMDNAVKDFLHNNRQRRRDPRDKFERFREKDAQADQDDAPVDSQPSSETNNSSPEAPHDGYANPDAHTAADIPAAAPTQQQERYENLGETFMNDAGNMAGNKMKQPDVNGEDDTPHDDMSKKAKKRPGKPDKKEFVPCTYDSEIECHPAPDQSPPAEGSGSYALDGDPIPAPVVDATQDATMSDEDVVPSDSAGPDDALHSMPPLPVAHQKKQDEKIAQEGPALPASPPPPPSRQGDSAGARSAIASSSPGDTGGATQSYDTDYEPYNMPSLCSSGKASASARHPLSSRSSYEAPAVVADKVGESIRYPWSFTKRPRRLRAELHAQPVTMPSIRELSAVTPSEQAGSSSQEASSGASSIPDSSKPDGSLMNSVVRTILAAVSYLALAGLSCAQVTMRVIRVALRIAGR